MWRRNLTVFVAIICAVLALAWVREPSWLQWTVITALLLYLAGGGAFFSFDGDFWTRAGLTSLAPAVALLLGEVAFGSELAFPGYSLALAAAAAAVCFLGSIFVAGPAFLWRRRRDRRDPGANRPGTPGRSHR